MATLKKATAIATEAHAGQMRFDGSPYINHPLRVMGTVTIQGHSLTTRIVAVLHDAVEDCAELGFDDLRREGFDDDVMFPLELLTKDPDEPVDYETYIQRLSVHPRARAVKRADLFDNMDLTGLDNPSPDKIKRIEKYGRSLLLLARLPQPRT